MSVLYGCIDFTGSIDLNKTISELHNGCAHFEHVRNNINQISSHASFGAMIRHTTVESVFDQSPFKYKNWVISSYSRLDNREILSKHFNISSKEQSETPDSILIIKAFEKWGEECVNHLSGDWVFSIWDKEKKELFLAKDFHGPTGVFYYFSKYLFAYCSSLKGLLNVSSIPKDISYDYLGSHILQTEIQLGESPFNGIVFLPPCHYIKVSDKGVKQFKYWAVEKVKPIRFKNRNDYYDHFLELFQRAVNNRLRYQGNIGSTLSGGLDSGAVSVLAAEKLGLQKKKLYSFTSVPEFVSNENQLNIPHRFVDEREYARKTAEYSGNIDLTYIHGNQFTVIESIRMVTKIDSSPVFAVMNAHWLIEIFSQAQSRGIKTLLNGQEGNNTVSWAGNEQKSLRPIQVLKSMFPLLHGHNTRKLSKKRYRSLLNASFYNSDHSSQKIDMSLSNWFGVQKKNSIEKRAFLLGLTQSYGGAIWQNSALKSNIEVPDPTSDKEIINYCLGIPDDIYKGDGFDRYLLRRSLKGYLPDKVRLNTLIGLQGIDSWYRIIRDKDLIKEFLLNASLKTNFSNVYNIKTLLSYLNLIIKDRTGQAYLFYGPDLMSGIAVAVFLEEFS